MDLLQNPFYLLGATTRDDRRKIVELADEKSLVLEPALCAKARSDLINPRNRLTAEVAWMVGVSPRRAAELVKSLQSDPEKTISETNVPPQAMVNLLATAFPFLDPELPVKDWAHWLEVLGSKFDEIDSGEVLRYVNEDRAIAGFPSAKGDAAESEFGERRRHCKAAIKQALDRLSPAKLVQVVTKAVDSATRSGSRHAPVLIDEFIDSYEIEAQPFLQKEAENILLIINNAKQAAPKGENALKPLLDRLDAVVRNWDKVAQPIQLSMKSRGLDHGASQELARQIRNLGIDLANEHDAIHATQRITKILQEVFAELPEVASKLDEDAETIDEIIEKRQRDIAQAKREIVEEEAEISFEANLGVVFKDKLKISRVGIQWKNRVFPLAAITRVRWGGIRHSVNGIPSGTTYKIYFGDRQELASVETRSEAIYAQFTDKLWRAVCVRLLIEMLSKVAQGDKYRFGEAIFDDQGVELVDRKLFGKERIYSPWSKLVIWNGPGNFCIGVKGNKKVCAELSYLEANNVHILESAIRMFWKKGGSRLSGLLEG